MKAWTGEIAETTYERPLQIPLAGFDRISWPCARLSVQNRSQSAAAEVYIFRKLSE